jgi:hypothetical protein
LTFEIPEILNSEDPLQYVRTIKFAAVNGMDFEVDDVLLYEPAHRDAER